MLLATFNDPHSTIDIRHLMLAGSRNKLISSVAIQKIRQQAQNTVGTMTGDVNG
jgi:hypothetical protein